MKHLVYNAFAFATALTVFGLLGGLVEVVYVILVEGIERATFRRTARTAVLVLATEASGTGGYRDR